MSTEMKAQVTLTLKDNLSSGIKELEKRLERLVGLFQKLNAMGDISRKINVSALTADINAAGKAVDSLTRKADAADQAIRRMGRGLAGANAGRGGGGFLPPALSARLETGWYGLRDGGRC